MLHCNTRRWAGLRGRRDQAAAITGSSSMRVVYRGERISNFVDHPRWYDVEDPEGGTLNPPNAPR